MSLRLRTLLYTALCLGVVALGLWKVFQIVVSRENKALSIHTIETFERLESEDIERNKKRATETLDHTLANLSIKTADWAMWDEAHDYVSSNNRDFVQKNISTNLLIKLRLNYLLIFNKAGNLVHGSGVDLISMEAVPIGTELPDFFLSHNLLNLKKDSSVTGLIKLENRLLQISVHPIMCTNENCPPAGTMVFIALMDSAEVERLSKIIHVELALLPLSEKVNPPPPDLTRSDSLDSFILLRGIDGNPLKLLQARMPRTIRQEGLHSLQSLKDISQNNLNNILIALGISGVVLLFALFLLLDILILRKIGFLSVQAANIAKLGDFSLRINYGNKNTNNQTTISDNHHDELQVMAQYINGMLNSLQKAHLSIAEHEAAMRCLLDFVPLALFTLDSEFKICKGASRYSAQLLLEPRENVQLEGLYLPDLLALDAEESNQFVDYLDICARGLLPENLLGDLNPCPERNLPRSDGTQRLVQVQVYPASAAVEGNRRKLLIIVTDLSDRRTLEETVQSLRLENALLQVSLKDPAMLQEFLEEAEDIIAQMHSNLQNLKPWKQPEEFPNFVEKLHAEIFRHIHTLRGSAASLGLESVQTISLNAENSLNLCLPKGEVGDTNYQEDYSENTPEDYSSHWEEFTVHLEQLSSELAKARTLSAELSNHSFSPSIWVDNGDMEFIQQKIMKLMPEVEPPHTADLKVILDKIRNWQLRPAHSVFARTIQSAQRLVTVANTSVQLSVHGGGLRIPPKWGRMLNGALVQLVRNAIAHGIESAEERQHLGKPMQSYLRLEFAQTNEGVEISVEDDGRGVQTASIMRRALELKLPVPTSPTETDVLALLCIPGFSTLHQANTLAGRGVGMDAVAQIVQSNGANLLMRSRAGQGSRFTIVLPPYLA